MTLPDVVNAVLVPLNVAQFPLPPHQLMFEPVAGFTPIESSAVVPLSSFRSHKLTGSGSDTVDAVGAGAVGTADLLGTVV
jgi:hypothetical protein